MALTKIKELTAIEAVALAYAEFGYLRFTGSSLAGYLCSILSDPFKVRSIQLVDELMKIALHEGAVESSPGPRGGPGYTVTKQGVELAAEVDLPRDKFERRAEIDLERCIEANANAGPVFEVLLGIIPQDNSSDRTFVESLAQHWLKQGWLSSRQVARLAEIATRHGQYIEERHYVGSALANWTEPYIKAQHRMLQEKLAAQQARARALAAERKRVADAKEAVRDLNRKVKAAIKEIAIVGGLAELDALVDDVFPSVNRDDMAKAVAFAGAGSKELRACTSMVAFGKPPSSVWKQAGNLRQPDAESQIWLTLVEHPACQRILERHARAQSGSS